MSCTHDCGCSPETRDIRTEALQWPIEPAEVRVGMILERRQGEAVIRARVASVGDYIIIGAPDVILWIAGKSAIQGWSLWLVEEPQVDDDVALVSVMAEAIHDEHCGGEGCCVDDHMIHIRASWLGGARAAIAAARAAGYRIEATR